jgi:hypothetical protein
MDGVKRFILRYTTIASCLTQRAGLRVRQLAALRQLYLITGECGGKSDLLLTKASYNIHYLCDLVARVPGRRHRGPGFDSRRYHIFCVAVGLERGPLSLVRINEELLERKSSGSELENRY